MHKSVGIQYNLDCTLRPSPMQWTPSFPPSLPPSHPHSVFRDSHLLTLRSTFRISPTPPRRLSPTSSLCIEGIYLVLHCHVTLHYTVFIIPYYTLHHVALLCTTLHYITLCYTTLHCTLHLWYITSCYTTLHYIVLHHITPTLHHVTLSDAYRLSVNSHVNKSPVVKHMYY